MKRKNSAPASDRRRSAAGGARAVGVDVAGDWPMLAASRRRQPQRREVAVLSPSRLALAGVAASLERPLPATVEHAMAPHGAEETSPETGSRLDSRLVLAVGSYKRVLVVGSDVDGIARALAGNGCQLSIASGVGDGPRTAAKRRFEVVALRGLLESVDNPVTVLSRLRGHLEDDGYLVAAVPNMTHGSVRLRLLAGQVPSGWFASTTAPVRFYDEATLRRVFEEAGLAITRLERHTEAFDSVIADLNGTAVPRELIAALMRDDDALTSAFVVVAHRFPLSRRTLLDIRMRELARTQTDHAQRLAEVSAALNDRDARYARADTVDRQIEGLDARVTEIGRALEANDSRGRDADGTFLRGARDAIVAQSTVTSRIAADLKHLQYDQLIARVRKAVDGAVPRGAVALVASKGDEQLLRLPGRTGWHFLQAASGVYAGHHPADSDDAIRALDRLRTKGATHLVLPQTAFWWLDHYTGFRDHLNRRCRIVSQDDRTCVIYSLKPTRRPR